VSLERQVLNACIEDRRAYERVKDHVSPKDFTPAIKFWWGILSEYYGRDSGSTRAERAVLGQLGEQRISNPKHVSTIMGALAVPDSPSSSPNVVAAVLGLRRYNAAAEFAAAAMAGDAEKARELLGEVNELWEVDTLGTGNNEQQYAVSIEYLFDVVGSQNRIPILPVALNERIGGGVMEGHNILVFGRTEVGKSTFAINMAAGLVRKGHRVLYIGNEDGINALKGRFVCRLTGKRWSEVEANRGEAIRIFRERGGEDNLSLVHMQPGTISQISAEIERFEPRFVFVDQIRNLASREIDLTPRLEANATGFRNLISRHRVVGVGIAQARDASQSHNAEPPIWLSTGDIADSRVGLPSQMDLILGIGGDSNMLARNQRSISLCKNKLAADEKSREGFIVEFDLARSGVK
jgi:DNA helicase HerA-like ATPase